MEEDKQLPIYLKGPAALEKRMILRKTLRQATRATERNVLQHQIAKVNLVLRDLRKKRRPPKLYHELDDLTDRLRVMARLAKNMTVPMPTQRTRCAMVAICEASRFDLQTVSRPARMRPRSTN